MAYQDTSLILAEPVKNNLYLAAPRRVSGRPTGGGRSGRGELLAEFDLDLELFPDAPAGVPHAWPTVSSSRWRKRS